MTDVLVIGGGPAGVVAALRACELGAKVSLIERGSLGGTCTNDGCAPTRVLAKSARLMREALHFGTFGLRGEPPQVDFPLLLAQTQQTVYRLHEKKQLARHLSDAGTTVYENAGAAQFVDAHSVRTADGARLQADKIIICAGGHARRLSFAGSEHALTHSDVWQMKQMPRTLAIVGGAATGCQLASISAAFGAQVTLLEVAPRLVAVEDEAVSTAMRQAFERRSIEVVTSIGGVERIEPMGRGLRLQYKLGAEVRYVDAETVITATGWPGNVESLNLDAAGIKSERGYIVVDDYLRTTTPHIFAAGDITGRMMLVQSASYEGRVAAENALLGEGVRWEHRIVPHGSFTDPEYASVGLTEAQARAQQDCVVATVRYADLDRALIDNHLEGFCKLIVATETHRILGAHIVGEQAVETINLVAVGMTAGLWIEQLAELELPYPTYASIVGVAARRIVSELGVTPLAPQWRTLGRTLAEWERSDA